MAIHESGEDYLETILALSRKNGSVRSVDIVEAMGVSKPSVSVAMKRLRQENCIVTDSMGYITLTEKGQKIAEEIYGRHKFLTKYLVALGVESETA